MRNQSSNTDARERVLQAAEQLFAQKGYAAVTLRDIAAEVGIRHASLYHHVPGGKEELFVEVTERNFKRHAVGLHQAMSEAAPDVRSQLQAIANWLLSQPPMDLVRTMHSDMPAIDETQANRLSQLALESLIEPIHKALQHAAQQDEVHHDDLGLVAGGILGMIEALYAVPDYAVTTSRAAMAHALIDVLLNGLRPR